MLVVPARYSACGGVEDVVRMTMLSMSAAPGMLRGLVVDDDGYDGYDYDDGYNDDIMVV